MVDDNKEMEGVMEEHDDLECPACGEEGFDKEGLSYHLQMHCKEYKDNLTQQTEEG